MKYDLVSDAFKVLAPLLVAALTWASTLLAQLINARTKTERVRAVLLRLDDAVAAIVREAEQVSIVDLRREAFDGRIPIPVRAQLKANALAAAKAYLGPRGVKDALRALALDAGAFDAFLGTRIEAAVLDLKNGYHRNGVATGGGGS
jgi:hypothetical protein